MTVSAGQLLWGRLRKPRRSLNTHCHQRPQPVRTFWTAQPPKRLGFDLPNPFTAQIELACDLFQFVLAIIADPKPHPDAFFLVRPQGLEDVRGFLANVTLKHRFRHRANPAVLDQVTERGFPILANWKIKGNWVSGYSP